MSTCSSHQASHHTHTTILWLSGKHLLTHTYRGHQLSLICFHGIHPVQFTCLTVFFHNLAPSFLWSTSWPGTLNFILYTFIHQSLSSFCSTCPYHCNMFCNYEIKSSNPSLSLDPLLGTLSCSFTPHIHLTLISAR